MNLGLKKEIFADIDKRRSEVEDFLHNLIATPSVTGEEGRVQLLVESKMREMGLGLDVFEADFDVVKKHPAYVSDEVSLGKGYRRRQNVIGKLRGCGGGRSLILASHIDTVPPGSKDVWRHDPYGGEVKSGRMFGRGAADDKGGLATSIMAVSSVLNQGVKLEGDVSIMSTVDEEAGGGGGMLACIMRGYRADGAIYSHPIFGEKRIGVATGGLLFFRVKVKGMRTHVYSAHQGKNAVEKAVKVVCALKELDTKRTKTVKYRLFNEFFGRSTNLFIGAIRGGDLPLGLWVPDGCEMFFEVSFPPRENVEDVKRQVEEKLKELTEADEWFKNYPPELEWTKLWGEPCETNPRNPFVQCMRQCVGETLGDKPDFIGIPSPGDMRLLSIYAKTPTVMFGGFGGNTHDVDEWVDIDSLISATKVIALTMLRWCGRE